MKDLIFLQCVPKDNYFAWQLEVQITNFRKFNIADKMEVIVWYPKDFKDFTQWRLLEKKYPEVKFFYYKDDGVDLGLYISQLRPHSLKKHFKEHEERLKDKVFFYHDSDIIFNFLPNFEELIKGDICWESNTSSYLDYNYLKRKEEQGKIPNNEIINTLAKIGKITPEIIESYKDKTGGAQTILKGIDYNFWEDIERMCLAIRRQFFFGVHNSLNKKYFTSEAEGLQSWCADMWALNFALWNRGKVTDITEDLEFSWATSPWEEYLKKPIMHNAGATGHQDGIFYKGAWINKWPLGEKITVSNKFASYAYVEAMKEVK